MYAGASRAIGEDASRIARVLGQTEHDWKTPYIQNSTTTEAPHQFHVVDVELDETYNFFQAIPDGDEDGVRFAWHTRAIG